MALKEKEYCVVNVEENLAYFINAKDEEQAVERMISEFHAEEHKLSLNCLLVVPTTKMHKMSVKVAPVVTVGYEWGAE